MATILFRALEPISWHIDMRIAFLDVIEKQIPIRVNGELYNWNTIQTIFTEISRNFLNPSNDEETEEISF